MGGGIESFLVQVPLFGCPIDLLLCRGLIFVPAEVRVVGGSADRAGLAGLQPGCEDPGLAGEKTLEELVGPLRRLAGCQHLLRPLSFQAGKPALLLLQLLFPFPEVLKELGQVPDPLQPSFG